MMFVGFDTDPPIPPETRGEIPPSDSLPYQPRLDLIQQEQIVNDPTPTVRWNKGSTEPDRNASAEPVPGDLILVGASVIQ